MAAWDALIASWPEMLLSCIWKLCSRHVGDLLGALGYWFESIEKPSNCREKRKASSSLIGSGHIAISHLHFLSWLSGPLCPEKLLSQVIYELWSGRLPVSSLLNIVFFFALVLSLFYLIFLFNLSITLQVEGYFTLQRNFFLPSSIKCICMQGFKKIHY